MTVCRGLAQGGYSVSDFSIRAWTCQSQHSFIRPRVQALYFSSSESPSHTLGLGLESINSQPLFMLSDSCLYVAWVRWPPGRTSQKVKVASPPCTSPETLQSCPTSDLLLCQLCRPVSRESRGNLEPQEHCSREVTRNCGMFLTCTWDRGFRRAPWGPAHSLVPRGCRGLGDCE